MLVPVTAAYTGLFSFAYVYLAFKVIGYRVGGKVSVGDGTKELNLLVLKDYDRTKEVPTPEKGTTQPFI